MKPSDVYRYRLINQQIAASKFNKPQEIVSWMVAMQAQEFAHAKWAIGLRLPSSVLDEDVEKAFDDGAILRTHLMRPTWHFITPDDIRWMLALTAPRVHAVNAYWYRKFELTPAILNRSNSTIANTVEGGRHLTRAVLQKSLAQKKIVAEGLRLGYIMMHAELDGIICSGPRQGKQFTYALLDERVPNTKQYDRHEALAEFTKRYFSSRGPATLQDFSYWSGLTMQEVREGVTLVKNQFEKEVIDGKEYLLKSSSPTGTRKLQDTFLMPDYDEYGMSYKDRSALSNPDVKFSIQNQGTYNHWIVIDGLITGAWKQIVKKNTIHIEPTFFSSVSKSAQKRVTIAMERYCSFFGKSSMSERAELISKNTLQ